MQSINQAVHVLPGLPVKYEVINGRRFAFMEGQTCRTRYVMLLNG
jgi:hypothetical protein